MRTYGRLREDIKSKFGTMKNFAKAMKMNHTTLSSKLSGKTDWKVGEMEQVCCLLEVSIDKVRDYFFYD